GGSSAGASAGSSGAHALGGGGASGAPANGGSGGTAISSAGMGGSAGAAACGHEFANAACWQEKDLGTFTSLEQSLFGAVFDGRYLVYVNEAADDKNAQVRFDTQGDFTGDADWSTFDAEAVK